MGSITLTAHVSKGTYIRSLARDIALALGTVGHVTMLRRTKAGPFTLEDAISLDLLDQAARERGLQELLLPLTAGLDDIPVLALTPEQAVALRQGRRLIGIAAPSASRMPPTTETVANSMLSRLTASGPDATRRTWTGRPRRDGPCWSTA